MEFYSFIQSMSCGCLLFFRSIHENLFGPGDSQNRSFNDDDVQQKARRNFCACFAYRADTCHVVWVVWLAMACGYTWLIRWVCQNRARRSFSFQFAAPRVEIRAFAWMARRSFFFIYLKILRKKTKILVASKCCKTNYRLENLMVNKSISNSKRKQNRHNDKNPKCFHTLYSGLSKCFTFEVSSQLNSEKDGSYLGGHFWGGKLQDKCLTNWSGTDCSRCWNVTRGILLRFCRSDDFVFNLK